MSRRSWREGPLLGTLLHLIVHISVRFYKDKLINPLLVQRFYAQLPLFIPQCQTFGIPAVETKKLTNRVKAMKATKQSQQSLEM